MFIRYLKEKEKHLNMRYVAPSCHFGKVKHET